MSRVAIYRPLSSGGPIWLGIFQNFLKDEWGVEPTSGRGCLFLDVRRQAPPILRKRGWGNRLGGRTWRRISGPAGSLGIQGCPRNETQKAHAKPREPALTSSASRMTDVSREFRLEFMIP